MTKFYVHKSLTALRKFQYRARQQDFFRILESISYHINQLTYRNNLLDFFVG